MSRIEDRLTRLRTQPRRPVEIPTPRSMPADLRRAQGADARERARRDLPDFVDLVVACVEAGLGVDAALMQACRYLESPLTTEFAAALDAVANGMPRRDAFMAVGMRLGLNQLTGFTSHLIRGSAPGVAVGPGLHIFADEMRHARFAEARERANRLPAQMAFVNVVFIPALIVELLGFFAAGKPQATLLFIVAAFLFPPLFVDPPGTQHRREIETQLPDALNTLAESLRAGLTLERAVLSLSRNLTAPLMEHFRELSERLQAGGDLELGLRQFARALKSREIDLLVAALLVQRRTGSNLAGILDPLAHAMRERVRMRSDLRAGTAQARITNLTLVGLPLAMGALAMVLRLGGGIMPGMEEMDRVFSFVGPSFGAVLVLAAFLVQFAATALVRTQVMKVESEA